MNKNSFIKKWLKLSIYLRAALWMIFANVCFAILTTLVRYLSNDFPIIQIIFFRAMFGAIFVLPWVINSGFNTLKTNSYWLHCIRACIACIAMFCWFYSIANLPLAQATAINYISPIFGTILAIFILKEKIKVKRSLAILVSFLGMLIIIRPGIIDVNIATLSAIIASFFMASGFTIVKILSNREHPNSIVFYMPCLLAMISFIPTIYVWKSPSSISLILLILTGIAATLAHQGLTRSFALADASYVVAFDYLRLPLVALIGYLLFSETPSIWMWCGSSIILLTTIYILKREKINNISSPPNAISERRIN